jgi:ATP-dependent DNA helicase DinG
MPDLELRNIQAVVINKVKEAIAAGKTDIFISAPTGTGKGIIALEVARRLLDKENWDSYVLTSEKSLQAQYEEDTEKYDIHSDAKSICGIDTYKCHVNNEKFSLGVCRMMGKGNSEALKMPCASTCEYLQRWSAAKEASRTIMNYSYWMIQMNYVLAKMEGYAPFQIRPLVVCDEAHKLPDIIEDHFACSIDLKFIERIRNVVALLRSEGHINHQIQHHDIESALTRCFRLTAKCNNQLHLDALTNLYVHYDVLNKAVISVSEAFAQKYLKGKSDITSLQKKIRNMPKEVRAVFRLKDSLKDRLCKLEDYIQIIKDTSIENLVVDASSNEERKYHNLNDAHLFQKHFKAFSKVRIYMSATIQANLLIQRFGIPQEDALILDVKSSWDKRRSPIVLCNTANMTFKNQDESLKKCVRKIDELMRQHRGQRGIIHTTSNVIMNYVIEHSGFSSRMFPYSGTEEKMSILDNFHDYPADAVLIGPSLTTGIDMKDDLARFNIVIKLSFPNMGSALWAKRYEIANHIYIGETASILEQSCGRTTRSEDDFSISYILDSRAKSFINGNRNLFSSSFLERIVKE